MHVRAPRLTTAAVATVIGISVASGCAPHPEPDARAGASSSTPASRVLAGPLTSTQLKGLTFKDGEVPQAQGGTAPVQELQPDGGRSFPPVSDPTCQAVNDIRRGRGSSAQVGQIFNWKDGIYPGGSTLSAYEDGRAARQFAELKKALASCRSYEGDGYTGKFRATVTPETPLQVGDEAVAFRESIPLPDQAQNRNEQIVVVRTGNIIATFSMLDVGRSPSFPAELVGLQVDRLRNAQRP